MPLPDYQASVEATGLPGRPYPRFPDYVSPEETGASIGEGIENAGSVENSVFQKQQAAAKVAENKAIETQVTDAHNQLQTLNLGLTHDPQTGAFTKQGKDAFGLTGQYLPQFESGAQQIIANTPNPAAQAHVQQAVDQFRTHLTEQLDAHELEQHKQFDLRTTQSSIKLAQQAAAENYNHPDIVASNHDTIAFSLGRLAKQQGWSDDQLAEAKQESFSSMHSDVIDRMLADDKPQMAQHYLDTVKDEMDARTAWSAARTIDAHVKEKQNEQKQDIADRFSDSMEAAQAGLKNPVTVSRAELNVLFPKDAQRRWDGLQSMAQAGAQAKQYDKMPAADVLADLKSHEPTEGGPEAAFQLRSYGILARAAEQSLKARTNDPAQFAITSGGWQPFDLSNPKAAFDELHTRANTAPQVSRQLGVPVPLLSRQETAQLASSLDNQTPAQKLGTLTAIHQAIPDERAYFDLMRQIAPHSPVTAIVGQKVSEPKDDSPAWYDSKFAPTLADAQRILTGEALLNPAKAEKAGEEGGRAKGTFPMPDENKHLRIPFAQSVGDMFRDRPELGEDYYGAYKDAYAALLAERGSFKGEDDSAVHREALRTAIGPIASFNGQNFAVPSGMDPTAFTGAVRAAVAAQAKALNAPEDYEKRIRGYQLREVGALGSGRYELVNGNVPLTRPDGTGRFTIDLRANARDYAPPPAANDPENKVAMARQLATLQ